MLPNPTNLIDAGEKDAVLNAFASQVNVAQFVSFAPDLSQRFAWLRGRTPNAKFDSLREAFTTLLVSAEAHHANIRSFKPGATKGNKLIRNLDSAETIASAVCQRAAEGFFTIVNESIPVDDGGVSGVATGEVIEFAPGGTPKCVDEPGVASFPASVGLNLLQTVYGFKPSISSRDDHRVEFSIHPIRRGVHQEHTIIWELEPSPPVRGVHIGRWPNRFSQLIGDKAYGLLLGDLLGFRVPKTTVFARGVAPFSFGTETGTREPWLRTCPRIPIPGKYPTFFGWRDPYLLLKQWDPDGEVLASVLAQESVEFAWSGAARTTEHGPLVEGVQGRGDQFMIAATAKATIPARIHASVNALHDQLISHLGSVKFEWVSDGREIWLLQLHRRPKGLAENVIYPGEPAQWVSFNPRQYEPDQVLDQLKSLVDSIANQGVGVVVQGDIGVTSHVGDILAEAKVPSRLTWLDPESASQLEFNLSQ